MKRPLAVLLGLALSGCGASHDTVAPPPAASPVAAPAPAPIASAPAASAPSSSAPTPPPSYETEYRQLLEQMVAVDTSHGGETKLLEPIAALYRDAGVKVQILESAPGRGNLLARLEGSGAKKPMLLLAHVDVVPVEGQPWTLPPFALTEKDGFLYGRGVNDDKAMAAAIVALTLELARSHAPLTRDVIVALTSGEETVSSDGVWWLTRNHKELIDADFALNEGGEPLLSDDLSKAIAVSVSVSEKIFQTYQLVVKGKGGHSSVPPTIGDPVVALARALQRVGELRFKPNVLPEAKAAFETQLASAEPQYVAALRRVIASAPRISATDDATLSHNQLYNAEIRTTCVTTMLKASPQDNVLPTTAEASVNCRILPGETPAQVHDELVKVIGDPGVTVTNWAEDGGGGSTPFDGEVVDAVKKAAATTYPGASVVPSMMTGASDSRHLRNIGMRAYGVTPLAFSVAEARSGHIAHGPDERRSSKWLIPGADFFRDVVRTLALPAP
jgi:acetylornithine deacetylase/succinyl-diaminopimelate desuccinylase-like protein